MNGQHMISVSRPMWGFSTGYHNWVEDDMSSPQRHAELIAAFRALLDMGSSEFEVQCNDDQKVYVIHDIQLDGEQLAFMVREQHMRDIVPLERLEAIYRASLNDGTTSQSTSSSRRTDSYADTGGDTDSESD